MHHKMHENQVAGKPLGTGTLTSGTPGYTLAYDFTQDANQFEECAVLLNLAAFSETPAAESLKVELQQCGTGDTDEADDYAVPTPAEQELKKTFGPVANGGDGSALESSSLMFHFSPGKYKKGVRLKLTLSTTAGDETIAFTAFLLGFEPRDYPVAQIPAAAVVTPS